MVGVGALGSHVADALARAGVGELWIVDRDVVVEDNLQRQVLFCAEDARRGDPKALAAARRLAEVGGVCRVLAHAEEFDAACYERLPRRPDVVVDGTDNFATRLLINDLCARDGVPWIYGGVLGARGAAAVVRPGRTPCLRCWIPDPPPAGETGTCETEGVLEPAVAAVAAFQTAQAIKLLAGHADRVADGVYHVDVWQDRYGMSLAAASSSRECPVCARGEFPALTGGHRRATTLCGRDTVQVRPCRGTRVDLRRLASRLGGVVQSLRHDDELLRFTVESCRFSVFPDGRALIFGPADPERARSLYDRYVGAT